MINNMDFVTRGKVANVMWEPYIINSFQETDISIWQSIKYVFVIHNDCGNVLNSLHFGFVVDSVVTLYVMLT